MRKYYYKKNGETLGPFALEQLRKEHLNLDTMIQFDDTKEWHLAKNIQELTVQTQMPFNTSMRKDYSWETFGIIALILYLGYSFGWLIIEFIKAIFEPQ